MSWYEYEYHVPRPGFRFGPTLSPAVKVLVIINAAAFVLQAILGGTGVFFHLCLVPKLLFGKLFIWQLFTYMFLHGSLLHIALNMMALWMFGSELESRLGRREFLQLYFLSGVGAGLCYALTSWGPRASVAMLGASGAVCGVLMAFAMLFPDRYITLFVYLFPLTIKAKHLVLGFAFLEVLSVVSVARDNIAHFAHLGGFVFGYLYMKGKFKLALPYSFAERFRSALRRPWGSTRRSKYKYRPIDVEEFIDHEVDPILAKISRYGMSSLTRKEKKILRKARSQMK